MALTPGSRLGVYAITAQIGEGGMGQVYRATDTTLGRQVAIKILPDGLASDPERLARFEREAKTLASLNHPHIAAIYAVETSAGLHALVMELVEGEDLSQRIARGAIPCNEALPIARQIADALEAAHEQGIVHRDLKPANIKVREDGIVKVLDFGLAKLVEAPGGSTAALSRSPTITSPAMMTGIGMILGTAAYMSPEQARGKVVDKRADIWAFGCVVFEMLTGQRTFEGELISDVLASVLKTDPNWPALPADVPVGVRRLLRRCLEKDPRRRLQAIGEARVQIEDLLSGAPDATVAPAPSPVLILPLWQRALPWASTGALAAGLAAMLMLWAPWRPAAARVIRTTITTSGSAALTIDPFGRDLAVSPDGTHVAYVGNGSTQLFVRALDALEPVAIATGTTLRGPFFSPDGQWVGFLDSVSLLTKVAVTGGAPIPIARLNNGARGATWAPDDTIIFATTGQTTGLQRVSAAGGTPEVLTQPDHAQGEVSHFWPEILPGGRAVLFTITSQSQTGGIETAQVAVRDLRTGAQKVLLHGGSHGHYAASGHLVYVAGGTLRAIAFDLNRLETRGTSVPVLQRLATKDSGTADFDVATDGTLVYVDAPGNFAANARTLVWVDRIGSEEPVAAPPRAYMHPRLSPDSTRIAVFSLDQEKDLWIWDVIRTRLTRLTLDPGQDWHPVWTPDSRRIVFSSDRGGGHFNLWWQAADGTGDAERLTTNSYVQFATGITRDGTAALFHQATPTMGPDLLQVALDGTHRVTPLVQTRFDERNGIVSPDGRWLAYQSNSSGPIEIYVQPFPNVDGGGQRQVSTAGGSQPLWSKNGKELFYVGANGTLMGVSVEAIGATWNNGTPTKLLEARYLTASGASGGRTYDVSPDGKRFLMIKGPATDTGATPPAVILVQQWDEELKRLVPTK